MQAQPVHDMLCSLPQVRWSVSIRDSTTGESIFEHQPARILKTASVAKLFLLAEVAARLSDARLEIDQSIDRRRVPTVRDSGLWYQLRIDQLPLGDVATLVAAVSDNWATNALIDLVGLDAVQLRSHALGYRDTCLHDMVRDLRTASHPPTLSTGSAADWSDFFCRLGGGTLISKQVDDRLRGWLHASVDHSLVASALNLDPLVIGSETGDLTLLNKTGADDGVRADTGLAVGERSCAYCAIANWDPTNDALDAVIETMHHVGEIVRQVARGDIPS